MIKLKSLLEADTAEDAVQQRVGDKKEIDLSNEEFDISERGYNYLDYQIEKLAKKGKRYGVASIELKIIKEYYKKIFVDHGRISRRSKDLNDKPQGLEKEYVLKRYIVKIEGKPPIVEGYEFIAKIEHTPAGNILNFNPHASVKNLPLEYRTATQKCDVCQTNRDRNNTFVLKMLKEDETRFPGKKAGNFIMAGSACLKRFLPTKDVNLLIAYAEMLEGLRSMMGGSEDDDAKEYGGGSGSSKYMDAKGLLYNIAFVYTFTGKFISKKKAQQLYDEGKMVDSTSGLAQDFEYRHKQNKKYWSKEIIEMDRMETEDEPFKARVQATIKEFEDWKSKKNFEEEEQKNPQYADFFHNMKVMAKSEIIGNDKSNMYTALFGMFLRDKGAFEKKQSNVQTAVTKSFVGKIGEKIKTSVTVKKVGDYETQYGHAWRYNMEDSNGNNLVWFTSTNLSVNAGDKMEIQGTVKKQENNKYTNIPETSLTRVKVLSQS